MAACLRYMPEGDDETGRALAAREGAGPAAGLRPRCTASVFSRLISTADREWRTEGGTVAAMLAAFDACARQVADALSGHWS